MHVISQSRVWEAKLSHIECASALDGWYRTIKKNNFKHFADLKATFKSVDCVGDFYIFNIGGNKLRLIANINFVSQKIYVRYILTHKEYDKNGWD